MNKTEQLKQELHDLQDLIEERVIEKDKAVYKLQDLVLENEEELKQIYGLLINKYLKTDQHGYLLINEIDDFIINGNGDLGVCLCCTSIKSRPSDFETNIVHARNNHLWYPIREIEESIITEEEFNKALKEILNTIKQSFKVK